MKENFTKATTSLETVFRRLGSALSLEQWKNITKKHCQKVIQFLLLMVIRQIMIFQI